MDYSNKIKIHIKILKEVNPNIIVIFYLKKNQNSRYGFGCIKIQPSFLAKTKNNSQKSQKLWIRAAIPYPGFVRTALNKQTRWSEFYKYTRLPKTRWVKLSLNFELLVPK